MDRKYTLFGEVTLPQHNPVQRHDPAPGNSTIVATVGGQFDWQGSNRATAGRFTIPLDGYYVGETYYLVDDEDDGIGDSGDYLIFGESLTMLHTQVSGLRSKIRERDTLWSERLMDGQRQWKTARLLSVGHTSSHRLPYTAAEMSCVFESVMANWHAETETERTKALASDGFGYNWIVEVDTELTIDDAVITIAYGSGTLTAAYIYCLDLGVDIELTGLSVTSGSLIIDCGAQTVRNSAGTDIYSYFDLGTEHTARGWCPLPGGNHQFNAKVVGGTATATIAFYSQTA